jgi:U3 small nucleolar RNA-associated protein 4
MPPVELHRFRGVEWTPQAVAALAPTADGRALAVGRDDGSLELYDVAGDWRCAARIPGCEGASITALLWCEPAGGAADAPAAAPREGGAAPAAPRLFSAGLSGQIVEWDLQALRPLAVTDSSGGPVWHMSARPQEAPGAPQVRERARAARACSQHALSRTHARAVPCGGVRRRLPAPVWCGCAAAAAVPRATKRSHAAAAVEPAHQGVAYRRSFPRIEARLLCTAWHPNRTTVIVGSSDGCLRCWDSRTTTELLRITLGHAAGPRAAPRAAPCVWSVLALPDGTLVSGDSEGVTSLWDGEHGTLRQAFKAHEADVLAVACTPSGDAIFAAGVDSKVALLTRVAGEDAALEPGAATLPPPAAWSLAGYKRAHTHDVRALAVAPFPPAAGEAHDADAGRAPLGSMLLSAGTDAQLLAYAAENFMGEHPVRVARVPPSPPLSLASPAPAAVLGGRPLLLCTHTTWLDIWQLGTAARRGAEAQVRGALSRRGALSASWLA